MIEQHLSREE